MSAKPQIIFHIIILLKYIKNIANSNNVNSILRTLCTAIVNCLKNYLNRRKKISKKIVKKNYPAWWYEGNIIGSIPRKTSFEWNDLGPDHVQM